MGTKNNPANRGKGSEAKHFDGKVVKPVLYMGKHVGHGTYMAAAYENGDFVTDNNNKPQPWDAV